MRVDIVTLFPDMIDAPLGFSILGRARAAGIVEINIINLRDFARDKRGTVDDSPFGGGAGMVLKPDVIFDAVESVKTDESLVILLTPQGSTFKQTMARELVAEKHLILICGHYEGVDERVRESLVDREISIGDYVLTNGALAALVITDAVVRLLPGALGSNDSAKNDSFGESGLLDYPQYTRPAIFRGMRVPAVLLSGNHGAVAEWRKQQAEKRTLERRPELIKKIYGED